MTGPSRAWLFKIMVAGDLNARTGILSDFNEIDAVKYVVLFQMKMG